MRTGIIDSPINDLWHVVHDSGELAAAVQNYVISGLNGDDDEEYELISRVVNNYDGVAGYKLFFNSDQGSNYGYQEIEGSNTTAQAVQGTHTGVYLLYSAAALGAISMDRANIQAKSGKVRTVLNQTLQSVVTTTVNAIERWAQSWNNTADNITSMTIASTQAGGIGIGSRFILLRKVHGTGGMRTGLLTPNSIKGTWQRVVDYTVAGAAITSYQIPNVAGNTYPIYRVRIRGVDKDTVGAWLLRLNNDSGATKYGYQSLSGENSTVAAGRGTNSGLILGYTGTNTNLTLGEMLLYLKSGFPRTAIHTLSYDVTGTLVSGVILYGGVYNDTTNEITTIDIVPTADKFDIGTHIEVDRLIL